MKILSPRIHGYLDYILVALFLLAPTFFGMSNVPSAISYALAAIHLTETILTAFPMGLVDLIPFTIHGASEFLISFVLMAMPWVAGFAAEASARSFFVGAGILIFVIWLTTDYKAAAEKSVLATA